MWNSISQKRSNPHHVLQPEDGGGESGDVRGRVIVAHEADSVSAPGRAVVGFEARIERLVSIALDEAERRIGERRRDREEGQRAAAVALEPLDLGDGRAASLLEEAERLLDVLNFKVQRTDAVGMLLKPARCATTLAAGLHADNDRVAGHEGQGLLPAGLRQLLVAAAELLEVHELGVETSAPLQVPHVVVDGLEPLDAERFHLGHQILPLALLGPPP